MSVVACLRHPPGYTGIEPSWLASSRLLRASRSTRSIPAVAGTSELESSSRRGGFWSGVSSWSRRFLPSWLAPESRPADTSIPDARSRSSLGSGGRDRCAAGTRRASTGTPPVPDSGHGRYADRYPSCIDQYPAGTTRSGDQYSTSCWEGSGPKHTVSYRSTWLF